MERQMDALGRIVLPAGYRKQKNLQAGDVLCVDEQEGKRMIYPRKARCALCGEKRASFPWETYFMLSLLERTAYIIVYLPQN